MRFRYESSMLSTGRVTLLIAFVVLLCSPRSTSQPISPSFPPPRYQTVICLPDDWLKTMVSEQGALTYDYGPGPYARPLTEISIGVKGAASRTVRQYLEDARVPIVTTILENGEQTIRQEAFALPPQSPATPPSREQENTVKRLGGFNGCMAWATPPTGTDPAFRNAAWGTNRPIRYTVKVQPGSRKTVVMGLCEPYKWGPGTRIVELHVEGAAPLTVSTMKDSVKNRPYAYLFHARDENGDGRLTIESHASPKSPDPNVILNAFWVFPEEFPVDESALIRGELSSKAETYYSCGGELERSAPSVRVDVIHASFSGENAAPIVTVRTRREMRFTASGELRADGSFFVFSRPRARSASRTGDGWTLELEHGTQSAEVIVVHGPASPDVPSFDAAIKATRSFWSARRDIAQGRIVVPDSGIQYILDASVRTMYQVRDSVEGHAQFQPGPTVYRGLWAGDAMLTGVSVMTLGDTVGARSFMESVLRHQLPSGQIRSLYPAVSLPETPVCLVAVCLYAKSFGDKEWLRKQWPQIVRGVDWVEQMHQLTVKDSSARYFGLMPPSFVDGGIAESAADYGSVWWAMVSLERVIGAAQWLGMSEQIPHWQRLLEELSGRWRKSAERDLAKDRFGNTYLPVLVGDTSRSMPQRGQYAFLWPFAYGRFFQAPDALTRTVIRGNLAMLDSTRQEGLICGSGWIGDGVWPWLGGVHGIAHDLAGNPSRASELLYAYADHATPTGTWNEEQSLKGKPERSGGDVSDAEASAVFVYHVRRLLVRERLDDLELLAGIPDGWLGAGTSTVLNQLFTEFGPVSMRIDVSPDNSGAEFHLAAIDGRGSTGTPVVFLNALKRQGFEFADGRPLPDRLAWTWGKELQLQFKRNPQAANQAR